MIHTDSIACYYAITVIPTFGWIDGDKFPGLNKLTDGHVLTNWGRDKMVAISQTTFSNAFFKNENA